MYETVTEVTEGIRITAKPAYRQQHSNPEKTCYIFSYRITIENQNEYTVRLLKRHWKVFDSSGEIYEEEGKGKGMG
ncbi:MAG: ApaG domain, partial [Flavobacteriales bacterium]